VRQLPHSSDGEHQYRIKNEREQYDRVVKESRIHRRARILLALRVFVPFSKPLSPETGK